MEYAEWFLPGISTMGSASLHLWTDGGGCYGNGSIDTFDLRESVDRMYAKDISGYIISA